MSCQRWGTVVGRGSAATRFTSRSSRPSRSRSSSRRPRSVSSCSTRSGRWNVSRPRSWRPRGGHFAAPVALLGTVALVGGGFIADAKRSPGVEGVSVSAKTVTGSRRSWQRASGASFTESKLGRARDTWAVQPRPHDRARSPSSNRASRTRAARPKSEPCPSTSPRPPSRRIDAGSVAADRREHDQLRLPEVRSSLDGDANSGYEELSIIGAIILLAVAVTPPFVPRRRPVEHR
jgi:hypothetical protein